jgi:hypothetical protein
MKRRRWQHIGTGKKIGVIIFALVLLVLSAQQPISFIPVLIGVIFKSQEPPRHQQPPPSWSQGSAGKPPPLPWEQPARGSSEEDQE